MTMLHVKVWIGNSSLNNQGIQHLQCSVCYRCIYIYIYSILYKLYYILHTYIYT